MLGWQLAPRRAAKSARRRFADDVKHIHTLAVRHRHTEPYALDATSRYSSQLLRCRCLRARKAISKTHSHSRCLYLHSSIPSWSLLAPIEWRNFCQRAFLPTRFHVCAKKRAHSLPNLIYWLLGRKRAFSAISVKRRTTTQAISKSGDCMSDFSGRSRLASGFFLVALLRLLRDSVSISFDLLAL